MGEKYLGENCLNGRPEGFFISFLQPVHVIVVNGASLNPCGHMLLQIGDKYTHVAGINGYPYIMDERGFRRYLIENERTVLQRIPVKIPKPEQAKKKLTQLIYERWPWMVLPNNCVHYVEEILWAGGSDFNSKSNCPRIKIKGEKVTGRHAK